MRAYAIALLVALAANTGCSIDNRTLVLEAGFSGAANSANTPGAGGRAGSHAGGASGASSPSAGSDNAGQAVEAGQAGEPGDADGGEPSFADGCTDLNRNGISDCTETLLGNPTFTTDVTHWTPEYGLTLAWDPLDLHGAVGSGSALITSSGPVDGQGNVLAAAFQCIPVHEGRSVSVWANAQIAPGTVSGGAELNFWFFANPGCPGESPAVAASVATETRVGQTVILKGTQTVPNYMVSLRVRLGVVKPFMAQSFSVRYDDVLVVER
ncbi:MAG: hypothetical protein ABUL62_15620 [Myxococcales bacterium]